MDKIESEDNFFPRKICPFLENIQEDIFRYENYRGCTICNTLAKNFCIYCKSHHCNECANSVGKIYFFCNLCEKKWCKIDNFCYDGYCSKNQRDGSGCIECGN